MKIGLPGRRRCWVMPESPCGWGWSRSKSRAASWITGSSMRSGPCASPPPRNPPRETCCPASDLSTDSFQKQAVREWCYPGQSVRPPGSPRSADHGAAAWAQCGRRTGAPPVRRAAWEPLHLCPLQSGLLEETDHQTAAKMSQNSLLSRLGELTELPANAPWLKAT